MTRPFGYVLSVTGDREKRERHRFGEIFSAIHKSELDVDSALRVFGT